MPLFSLIALGIAALTLAALLAPSVALMRRKKPCSSTRSN